MYKKNICNFQLIRMICARIKPFWETPGSKKKTDRKFYCLFGSFLFNQPEFKIECVCIVRGQQNLNIALSKTVTVYSYLELFDVCACMFLLAIWQNRRLSPASLMIITQKYVAQSQTLFYFRNEFITIKALMEFTLI